VESIGVTILGFDFRFNITIKSPLSGALCHDVFANLRKLFICTGLDDVICKISNIGAMHEL
jgi:hypothetical protein